VVLTRLGPRTRKSIRKEKPGSGRFEEIQEPPLPFRRRPLNLVDRDGGMSPERDSWEKTPNSAKAKTVKKDVPQTLNREGGRRRPLSKEIGKKKRVKKKGVKTRNSAAKEIHTATLSRNGRRKRKGAVFIPNESRGKKKQRATMD